METGSHHNEGGGLLIFHKIGKKTKNKKTLHFGYGYGYGYGYGTSGGYGYYEEDIKA